MLLGPAEHRPTTTRNARLAPHRLSALARSPRLLVLSSIVLLVALAFVRRLRPSVMTSATPATSSPAPFVYPTSWGASWSTWWKGHAATATETEDALIKRGLGDDIPYSRDSAVHATATGRTATLRQVHLGGKDRYINVLEIGTGPRRSDEHSLVRNPPQTITEASRSKLVRSSHTATEEPSASGFNPFARSPAYQIRVYTSSICSVWAGAGGHRSRSQKWAS
jgi:hypothetical protein